VEDLVYVDGTFVAAREAAVNVFDHGLLYGDGVFEGIRAYSGRIFKLDRHIERLFDSAKAIRLEIPIPPRAMTDLVVETCRRNAIEDGYVRLVVTRGVGTLGIDPRSCPRPSIIVIARPAVTLYRRTPGTGITLATASLRRVPPDVLSPSIKSLNYLNNVLARIEANDRGADEALLLDREGFVAEATVDNIFVLTGSALATPPTATNLCGITRETVLELAAELKMNVEERRFTLFDLWTAREAFLCGTSAEIVPVASVDGRRIGTGLPGLLTQRLVAAYERLVRSTGTPIPRAAASSETGVAASC
jgi:branched-chain amino acid aminotransferase